MKADRELDALIAEKVMGLPKPEQIKYKTVVGECTLLLTDGTLHNYPGVVKDLVIPGYVDPYSSDISFAWKVLEQFPEVQRIERVWIDGKSSGFMCELGRDNGSYYGYAPTPAHAICLAALSWVKEMESREQEDE